MPGWACAASVCASCFRRVEPRRVRPLQCLDRHPPVQPDIARPIDRAHSAGPDAPLHEKLAGQHRRDRCRRPRSRRTPSHRAPASGAAATRPQRPALPGRRLRHARGRPTPPAGGVPGQGPTPTPARPETPSRPDKAAPRPAAGRPPAPPAVAAPGPATGTTAAATAADTHAASSGGSRSNAVPRASGCTSRGARSLLQHVGEGRRARQRRHRPVGRCEPVPVRAATSDARHQQRPGETPAPRRTARATTAPTSATPVACASSAPAAASTRRWSAVSGEIQGIDKPATSHPRIASAATAAPATARQPCPSGSANTWLTGRSARLATSPPRAATRSDR